MFTIDIMIMIASNKNYIKSYCEFAKNVLQFRPHYHSDKNRTNFNEL